MKRISPSARRWLAQTLKLGAFLALTGFYAPNLQAQEECEDVSGAWAVDLNLGSPQQVTLTLEQNGCEVTGVIEGQNVTPIEDGEVEGSTVTFSITVTNRGDGQSITFAWEGTVEGNDISGTLDSDVTGTVEFTGTKVEG